MIVSCSADKKLATWSILEKKALRHKDAAHTGKELLFLRFNRRVIDHITCCRYSPDGKTIATSSKDGTIKIWNVPGLDLINTIKAHTG